ncbi:unnamed protein product [Paramecium octaurelia]|uniref:MORN repeat protein n=1 Tax=Paramecium octaurelia TaxID=43137 RepID=A0A8S1S8L9_PAROT|nr:unnamed protein product [Paramecium octaurelia]
MIQNQHIAIDFQQDSFWKELVQEFQAQISRRLLTKDVLLKFTNIKEIVYIIDGSIIRIDQISDTKKMLQIMQNLEQIKYLKWMGNYGQKLENGTLFGEAAIKIWEDAIVMKEESREYGRKFLSIITSCIKDINSQVQVYEFGLFNGDLRQGVWKIIHNDQAIGEGSYDLKGNKIGQWQELHQYWEKDSREIIFKGEYKNGQKFGRWDTVDVGLKQNKVIGKWVELYDLWDQSVTYHGEYKNGERFSSWTIKDREDQKIGGGSYTEKGIKNGEWIEICAEWRSVCQINFKGVYKNGKKIGFWDTLQYGDQKIGGGKYNDNGLKDGKWIELHDEWQHWDREVTFEGEYLQGKKIGKWNTILNGKQNIGGGQYDQDGLKSGQWVDLCDGWEGNGANSVQFTYNGEYLKGKKVGRWDTFEKNQKLMYLTLILPVQIYQWRWLI